MGRPGGGERVWRGIAGALISPMRGFNRLVTGRVSQRYANAPDRRPSGSCFFFDIGARIVADRDFSESDTTTAFFVLEFQYGDPWRGDRRKPFSAFDFYLQWNFQDVSSVGVASSRGLLASTTLARSSRSETFLGAFHIFDYLKRASIQYGGQAVAAGLMSSRDLGRDWRLTGWLGGGAILLGATQADYYSSTGRSCDYGPGILANLDVELGWRGWRLLRLTQDVNWISTMNGNAGNHLVSFTWINLGIPIYRSLGLGVSYQLCLAERHYEEFPDVSARSQELHLAAHLNTWR